MGGSIMEWQGKGKLYSGVSIILPFRHLISEVKLLAGRPNWNAGFRL
jgi:hypothetical protein